MTSESHRVFGLICLLLLLVTSACRQTTGQSIAPSDNKSSVIVENSTLQKIGNSPSTVQSIAPSDNKSSVNAENSTLPKISNPPSVRMGQQDNGVPKGPIIKVVILAADQISYGQVLNVEIAVSNHGDVAARNIHLYCRADPGGYFITQVMDQPFVAPNADDEDVSLNDLNPGDQETVNFGIQSPQFSQIGGEWSQYFHFDFTIAHDNGPESNVAVVTLSTGKDKMLVQTSGFAQ